MGRNLSAVEVGGLLALGLGVIGVCGYNTFKEERGGGAIARPQAPKPRIDVGGVAPDKRQMAERAAAILLEECPRLVGNWKHVVGAAATYEAFECPMVERERHCMNYRAEDYGWPGAVYVQIRLSDAMPAVGGLSPGQVAGHTMHFWLGGGSKPGITVSKGITKWMCGLGDRSSSDDAFIPAASLSFVR